MFESNARYQRCRTTKALILAKNSDFSISKCYWFYSKDIGSVLCKYVLVVIEILQSAYKRCQNKDFHVFGIFSIF